MTDEVAGPVNRLDRRKQRTRAALIKAAQSFIAEGRLNVPVLDITQAADVGMGSFYNHFESKEQLFEAIVEDERGAQAEQIFALDADNHNVGAVLTSLGVAYARFLCQPAAASALRTVIAIAERMPELGRKFYEFGPKCGIERLAIYLNAQCEAGLLAIEDCEIAAAQFLDACQSTMFKPVMFGAGEPPTEARVQKVVGTAVKTFLAAYKPR